eukprot:c27069_g2_i1 orf=455-1831(-)
MLRIMQTALACVVYPPDSCARNLDILSASSSEFNHGIPPYESGNVHARFCVSLRRTRQSKRSSKTIGRFFKQMATLGMDRSGSWTEKSFTTFSRFVTDESVSSTLSLEPLSSEQKVYNVVLKQAAMVDKRPNINSRTVASPDTVSADRQDLLAEAFNRCGEICGEYAKTFYLGTRLMTPERRRAIWAIYVWCRRTDELVDGPNSPHITPTALDRWEQRLEDVFNGKPYDMLDSALADTVTRFPVDIQPFRDMIEGMRLDLVKSRYDNFDDLYLYCYYVAGTVGLMSVPVMGVAPESKATTETVYAAALALGIANQLTNILRDVGEDARRGRIYLPRDELAQFNLSEDDIFAGKVTDKWRAFMKSQIKRARMFFDEAEKGVMELEKASRWPVFTALRLYCQILDSIESNDYNNFTKRAYVGKCKKLLSIPTSLSLALMPSLLLPRSLIRSPQPSFWHGC